ncbi:MAG: hypothetical protein U0W40_16895 [Acidimicrobiia bacterium]
MSDKIPRSVARAADKAAMRPRWWTWGRLTNQILVPLRGGDTWPAVFFYVFVVGIAFLPFRFHLGALAEPAQAVAFISSAWQVLAAAIALTLAVAFFAFESSRSSGWGISLHEFASATSILVLVHLGVATLLLDWMVLLHWGTDSPAGWSATWAAVMTGVSLAGIPILFIRVMQSLDAASLRTGVQRKVTGAVELSVQQSVRERISLNLLERIASELGIDFVPLFSFDRAGAVVKPVSAGTVTDIRARRLKKALSKLDAPTASSRRELNAYIGRSVGTDDALMKLDEGLSDATLLDIGKCFRIRDHRGEAPLGDAMTQLRRGATAAVRDGNADQYREWCDLYEELLLAFPQAWAIYGLEYDNQTAQNIHPFMFTDLDGVSRDLAEQFRQAVSHDHLEVTRVLDGLLYRVASRAVPLRAHALSGAMVHLAAELQGASRTMPQSHIADQVCTSLRSIPFSFAEYELARKIRDDAASLEDRLSAADFLLETYATLREIIKMLVEQGDQQRALDLIARWQGLFEFWTPTDELENAEWTAKAARDSNSAPDVQRSLDERVSKLRPLAEMESRLNAARAQSIFEIACWALWLFEQGQDPSRLSDFVALSRHIGSFADIYGAARGALEEDRSLSTWIMVTLPERRVHFVGGSALALRGLALMLVATAPATGEPIDFEPSQWLHDHAEQLESALDQFPDDWQHWDSVVPGGSVTERRESVQGGIERALDQFRLAQRQKLVAGDVSAERVEAFQAELRKAVQESRLGSALISDTEDSPSLLTDAFFVGSHQRIPKDWFMPDCRIANVNDMATELGATVGRGEWAVICGTLATAPDFAAHSENLAEILAAAQQVLRDRGFTPQVVVGPIDWRTWRALGLERGDRNEDVAPNVGSRMRHWIQGTLGGSIALQWPDWPSSCLVVADLDAFVRLERQTDPDTGSPLVEELEFYDEASARLAVEQDPDLLREDGRDSVELRSEELRTQARLKVGMVVRASVRNSDAALKIEIPIEDRDT